MVEGGTIKIKDGSLMSQQLDMSTDHGVSLRTSSSDLDDDAGQR
jgi:hypothetical protein